jgi:DNA-binding response OmpR family regulator
MKILIVDDRELVSLSLSSCLAEFGYEVKCASTIYDASEVYNEFHPLMVIVCINEPLLKSNHCEKYVFGLAHKILGIDIIKHIRKVKKHFTSIMVLSEDTKENFILRGNEFGFSSNLFNSVDNNIRLSLLKCRQLIADNSILSLEAK